MRSYIYRGQNGEWVPKDTTYAIVHASVKSIHALSFAQCRSLVSVTMFDSVEKIEKQAFYWCISLRSIRLSRCLISVESGAFEGCRSLDGLFLPNSLRRIGHCAFLNCSSMKVLVLPPNIQYIGSLATLGCNILPQIPYQWNEHGDLLNVREVNECLKNRRHNLLPFHLLCHDTSINTKLINDFVEENGDDGAFEEDEHGMTPLHILSMNPHASPHVLYFCYETNPHAAVSADNGNASPLDYAQRSNINGLIALTAALSIDRGTAYFS